MREAERSLSQSHDNSLAGFASTHGRLRGRARWNAPDGHTTTIAPVAASATTAPAAVPAFLPELDGLRGVAIALVFLIHAEGLVEWGRSLDPTGSFGWLRTLFYAGHTGVSLFFVLSGFLVARPFVAALASGRSLALGSYALRRFWRIVPLYALAVVATTAFMARTSADLWRGLPYLFFYGPFLPREARVAPIVTSVWWSLSTEMQFYVVLPLVVLAFRGPRGRRHGLIVLGVLAAVYVAAVARTLPLGNDYYWRIYQSVIGRGPLFAYGVLAAWICERSGGRVRAWVATTRGARIGADVLFVATGVALFVLLTTLARTFDYVTLEQWHPTWHLAEGALWTTIVLLCVLAPARAAAALRVRGLQHLGRISYSIYLVHQPVMFGVFYLVRLHMPGTLPAAWEPTTIATTCAIAAVVVALGHVSWRVIEQPLAWRPPTPPDRDLARPPRAADVPAAVDRAPRPAAAYGVAPLGSRRAMPCHMTSAQRAYPASEG